MKRHIAFLRAINVGGHTVTMDRLRTLFESLGLERVETFIASGNVIFESPAKDLSALERRIEQHLKQALGYEVATFLRSPEELAAVVTAETAATASSATKAQAITVAFLKAPPSEDAWRKLMSLQTPSNDFLAHEREILWLSATRMSESTFSGALLEKTLGMPSTMRNVTTVRKLCLKYAGAGS